jgi:hypothetical protein
MRRKGGAADKGVSGAKDDTQDTQQKKMRRWQLPQLLVLVVLHVACISFAAYRHTWLPKPVAATAPLTQFSEERVRSYLNDIMQFGVRVVGSEANEKLTPAYLVQQVKLISARNPSRTIDVEIQRPSGSFWIDFIGGMTNAYDNVTNVLVRLHGTRPVSDGGLLISAHFDAALGAGAASDDGVQIASMLEILSVLSAQAPLEHSLLLNFNGAEETILQAAHGFVTQHEWAKEVRCVINLEAAGAGGRELLFQTGPRNSWLAEAYALAAPYPHSSVIGQEVRAMCMHSGAHATPPIRLSGNLFTRIISSYLFPDLPVRRHTVGHRLPRLPRLRTHPRAGHRVRGERIRLPHCNRRRGCGGRRLHSTARRERA